MYIKRIKRPRKRAGGFRIYYLLCEQRKVDGKWREKCLRYLGTELPAFSDLKELLERPPKKSFTEKELLLALAALYERFDGLWRCPACASLFRGLEMPRDRTCPNCRLQWRVSPLERIARKS